MKVFVFGSNEAGKHGAGSALTALKKYGAVYGVGRGFRGNSYAIPTKDIFLRTRRLDQIRRDVNVFLQFAAEHEEMTFKVSKVGCGLAGYKSEDVAPLFVEAGKNVMFTEEWEEIIGKLREDAKKG